MMKKYQVKMLSAVPENFDEIEKAMLDEFVWLKAYKPVSYAQVVFVKGDGFYARLTCEEAHPKAVHTEWFSDVYKDSCLEFFAAFDAANPAYINIEINSVGASLIALGKDRYARTPIDTLISKPFDVQAEVEEGKWHVTVHIPLSDLEKIYGIKPEIFTVGYAFRGNFYKCGDETAIEHYGMWNPVGTAEPDYHRPEFFGTLILT